MRFLPSFLCVSFSNLLINLLPVTFAQLPVNITIDTKTIIDDNFRNFSWHSCGYSPAEVNLRADGVENIYHIGSTHRRGISQVRIHFLLDLLIVTGFLPNSNNPSGYELLYDWSLLDYALDILITNHLSPGFEFMGSPVGFPTLPVSFWEPWNNNFRVPPNQTIQMFRQVVFDIIQHYYIRYGPEEVQNWRLESWNEPECGWGWNYTINDPTSNVFQAYTYVWDAIASGVHDAEQFLNISLKFGGPGSCRNPEESVILQWVFMHAANGTNIWNNQPGRLDFISIHYKGHNTSYFVAEQALDGFTWMRNPQGGNVPLSIQKIPFYNDEADPLVGWLNPQPWRADTHYGAIIPKVINQHILQIIDNNTITLNNPLGLLSNDNGFMNLDGYNGFEQRTMLGKFTNNTTSQYVFIRKQSLYIMHLLSKLGSQRVNYTGNINLANMNTVAYNNIGMIATITPENSSINEPNQISLIIYNSNDTTTVNDNDPNYYGNINIQFTNTPFTSSDTNIVLVHYRLDINHANPYQTWLNQGSPGMINSNQTLELWESAKLIPLAKPQLITLPSNGQPLIIPSFILPLPGVSLLHIIAQPITNTLVIPQNVIAYIKDPSLTVLDTSLYTEIFIKWDCDINYNNSNLMNRPSNTIWGYTIQYSIGSSNGPWLIAQDGNDGDYTCSFIHPLPISSIPTLPIVYYQVQSMDYWNRTSSWSPSIVATNWPSIA